MIWMYLTKDSVGPYSKIINGVIGDRVAILKHDKNLCLVLHESGHKFYCNFEILSNQKIEKQNAKISKTETKKKRV